MPPWNFQLPTAIHFGRGLLRRLGPLAAPLGTRALIVGYRAPGPLDEAHRRAEQSLTKAGLAVESFLEVDPEPETAVVDRCAAAVRGADADLVIGLGGGSVLDVAKAGAALARAGGPLSDLLTTDPAPAPAKSLPVLAVPTTAGTGSEVSDVAVFSAPGPAKIALFGPALRPQLAVIDPELALGSPPSLTAACGADALGHAIEACISRRANPMAALFGAQAVALILENLAQAVEDPAAIEPREALAWAATLAGAAFTSAGVTGAHAVAQALTVELGLAHGQAVALATVPMLRHNAPACEAQYAELARRCRLPDPVAFLHRVEQLLRDLNLLQPPPLAHAPGVLDRLVTAALAARVPVVQNPVRLDESALRTVFGQVLPSCGMPFVD